MLLLCDKSRIQEAEGSFARKFHFNLGKKLTKCYVWSFDLYGAENWTLGKGVKKYLESF